MANLELTLAHIQRAPARLLDAPDGDYSDRGLVLRKRGTACSWIYRYTSPVHVGRRREIGLGSARCNTEEEARATIVRARSHALELTAKIVRGVDPKDARDAEKAARRTAEAARKSQTVRDQRSLGRAIRGYHETEIEASPKFTRKYKAQWLAPFENHLRSYRASADDEGPLWRKPIAEVTAVDLLDFLKGLQRQLPHTSRKARQRLDAVFEHGRLHGWNTERPTQAIVRALRKAAPSMKNKPHRKARWQDAPALFAKLKSVDSTASRCLQFTVLTAARTNEAINAEWRDINLEAGTWVVPAERMKMDEEHRVDLSPQALAVLRSQLKLHPRWVFPSPKNNDKPLSSMGMLMVLRRLKLSAHTTTHGLARGTFSTWANETGAARPDVIEAALAHNEADRVRAAYNTAKFFDQRRQLLRNWADFLCVQVERF